MNSALKILIVDDLSSARKVLRRLLTNLGYQEIDEARDGEEAYNKLIEGNFDLVISDWEMPKLKGIELLEKMRSEERFMQLPFIMITSNNKKEAVIAAAGLKVSDFIGKPFDQTVLAAKIEQVLSKN